MADTPHNPQLGNQNLQLVQQDIQNQFAEKRDLQERVKQLIKYVLVPFGALLPILTMILWIESGTIFEIFSLQSITTLAEEATTESFLQTYHSELVLAVVVFGIFTLLAHAIYFIFVKFLPMAIELMSSTEMRSGVKSSRYAAIYGSTKDEKAEQLLHLDMVSALEHNQEILEKLQTQFDESLKHMQKGVILLISTLLVIFVPLITQSSLGFLVGGTGAAIVGTLLLLNEITMTNYSDLLVHDPKTDLAIIIAILAILPLSLFAAAPLIIVGPLVVVVGLSHGAIILFSVDINTNTRLAIATRTLFFSVVSVILLGAVQTVIQDLPSAVFNISLGVIGSLVFSTGVLMFLSIIDGAGEAGLQFARFIIN